MLAESARAAGYVSPQTAQLSRIGVHVLKRNKKALDSWRDRLDLSTERALREVMALAYQNPTQVAEWDATGLRIKPSAELDAMAAATIQEISEDKETRYDHEGNPIDRVTLKVKFHPKGPALVLLTKLLKMVDDRPQINVLTLFMERMNLDALTDEELDILQRLAERSRLKGALIEAQALPEAMSS